MIWKGVDGILKALAELPEDVELLVAGDGDMEEAWKALAVDLDLGERVHFLGNVPHHRIPLLIRAADVFVLNSRYEGLSHTLLEVLQFETPMVVSRACGNPEVVEDGVNGLLVDPADHLELAGAVAADLPGGVPLPPGRSLVPLFKGEQPDRHDFLWWFHDGHRALRVENWKLVAAKGEPWELYNLDGDRSESVDLCKEEPEKTGKLGQALQAAHEK